MAGRQALHADVNLVTALVPSDTACLASSPGSTRRTAVWISREVRVGFLFTRASWAAWPAIFSNWSTMKLLRMAMALLLMEGTGTAFVAPFIISDTSGGNQTHILRRTPLAVLYGILNLSAFTDTTSDELIWQAKATANAKARQKVYARATELIQSEARLTTIAYQKYALAYRQNVKGVGELGLVNGGARKLITNFGIDFTGVWKSGK